MHNRKVKIKWKVIAPEGLVFKCITVIDVGLAKSTRKRRSHKVIQSEKLQVESSQSSSNYTMLKTMGKMLNKRMK